MTIPMLTELVELLGANKVRQRSVLEACRGRRPTTAHRSIRWVSSCTIVVTSQTRHERP